MVSDYGVGCAATPDSLRHLAFWYHVACDTPSFRRVSRWFQIALSSGGAVKFTTTPDTLRLMGCRLAHLLLMALRLSARLMLTSVLLPVHNRHSDTHRPPS